VADFIHSYTPHLTAQAYPRLKARSAGNAANGTSLTVQIPRTRVAGDLLVLLFVKRDNTATVTMPSGWTVIDTKDGAIRYRMAYRVSDGTETTVTVTTNVSSGELFAAILCFEGAADPASLAPVSTSVFLSSGATTFDPPALTLASGRSALWVAGNITAFQGTNAYNLLQMVTSPISGYRYEGPHLSVAVFTREKTGTSEDPGSFTVSNAPTVVWAVYTLAVPGANTTSESGGVVFGGSATVEVSHPLIRDQVGFLGFINTTVSTVNGIPLPSKRKTGDILLWIAGAGQTNQIRSATFPSGWTKFFEGAAVNQRTVAAAYRIADGTEPDLVSITWSNTPANSNYFNGIYCLDPAGTPTGNFTFHGTSAVGSGSTSTPDPPALTLPEVKQALWIAGLEDGDCTPTAAPDNYTFGISFPNHYSHTFWRIRQAQTEDPSPITLASTIGTPFRIYTLAVARPAIKSITQASLSGAFDMSGTVMKGVQKTVTGLFDALGAVTKAVSRTVSGTFDMSGTVARGFIFSQAVAGVFDMLGAVVKQTIKTFSGTLDETGNATKQTILSKTGTLPEMSGVVTKQPGKLVSGAFDMSGVLATAFTVIKSLAGTVGTLVGNLTRMAGKPLSGAFTSTGEISKSPAGTTTGSMPAPAGETTRLVGKRLSGTLPSMSATLEALLQHGGNFFTQNTGGTLPSMSATLEIVVGHVKARKTPRHWQPKIPR
jgi:hypothetical protein